MSTQVYNEETYKLQDGTEVLVRPLNIKFLKQFMAKSKEMNEENIEDDKMIDILFDLTSISIARSDPSLAKDRERLEDALDIPTMHSIIYTASGIDFSPKDVTITKA